MSQLLLCKDRKEISSELLLLFYLVSFLGWIFEVIVYWENTRFLYSPWSLFVSYRGVLHGPWAPIYGVGCILLVSLYVFSPKRKVVFIMLSLAVCAAVEYGTSWILETLYHARWWDYTGYFLNLNGRICFLSVFGLGFIGGIGVILGFPLYQRMARKIPAKCRKICLIFLSFLFVLDITTALFSPNRGIGVTLLE